MASTSLREKWIDILYRAATSSSWIRTLLTPLGAGFFLLLLVFLVVVSLEVDTWLGLPPLLSASLHIIGSLPLLALGLFFMSWSILHFLKVRGTPVPFNPPPKLVTTGPYALVRNPMLSGVFIVFFGLGLLLRSISLFFIFTPLFILLNVLELKGVEEPELERRLGKAYLEYKKRVPMFFPKLTRRKKRKVTG
jgi:protein-S-isoprenylcysteine O-methyltransferase Ste14